MNRRRKSEEPSAYAKVEGSPGEAPRLTGLLKSYWPLFFVFAAAGYLIRAAWPYPPITGIQAGLFMLLLSGIFATLMIASEDRMKRYLKGAKGEEVVARNLGFLSSEYQVFHGLTVPRQGLRDKMRELDHVVIGPSGIFVVETKNWSGEIKVFDGKVLYNGEEPDRPPIDQVRKAADALGDHMTTTLKTPIDVQPVLCFAHNRISKGQQGVNGVVICDLENLNRVIKDSVEDPWTKDLRRKTADLLETMLRKGAP